MSAVVLIACLFFLSSAPACAEGYDSIASQLTAAALKHGKKRVAVLPFQSLPASRGPAGTIVSERLTSRLMKRGKLDVVERTLLENVMSEQRLGVSGVVEQGTVKELGRVLGVDAVVAGTLISLSNGRIEINSRMIDAQTAQVLAAGSAEVTQDWSESIMDRDVNVPVPQLPDSMTAWPKVGRLNDSLNSGCEQTRQVLDERQKELIDVKARYWARRVCERGFSLSKLTQNPGSDINDEETRDEFYAKLRGWSGCHAVPDVTDDEKRALDAYEKSESAWAQACRQQLAYEGESFAPASAQ